MKIWMKYLLYLIWVIGLFLFIFIAYRYSMQLKQLSQMYFNLKPIIWFAFIAPFLFGVYFGILFIRSWRVQPNIPLLLCVFLPTLILSIWNPVAWSTIPSGGGTGLIEVPSFVVATTTTFFIPQFVCGFTLLLGLFSSKSE